MTRDWFSVVFASWESVTVLLIVAYVGARSLFAKVSGTPNHLDREAYILFVLSSLGAGIAITQIKASLARDPLNELRSNLLSNADAQYVRRKVDELIDEFRQFQANHLEWTGPGFVSGENAALLGLTVNDVTILDLQPSLLNSEAFRTLKNTILRRAQRLQITRIAVIDERQDPCSFGMKDSEGASPSRLIEKFITRADFDAISAEFGTPTTRQVTDNLLFLYDGQILSVASPTNGADLGHLQIWWMVGGAASRSMAEPGVLLELIRRTANDPRSRSCGT